MELSKAELPGSTVLKRRIAESAGALPYLLKFTPGELEVTARLTDEAACDELIRQLTGLKLLFRPADSFKKPDPEKSSEKGEGEE